MSRVRGVLTVVVVALLALAGAIGGAAGWLFYTESGLRWLSERAIGFAGEGLTLDGVSGTLARGARISSIRYAGDDIEIRIEDAALSVSPLSVLALEPHLRGLAAREVAVLTKPGEPRGKPPDSLELPVDFEVSDGYIGRLV